MLVSRLVGGRRVCGIGEPNPPFEVAIWMVALAVRSKASRHVSAGGHLSIMSVNTDFAASTVKSTSSIVYHTLFGQQGLFLLSSHPSSSFSSHCRVFVGTLTRRLLTAGECQIA